MELSESYFYENLETILDNTYQVLSKQKTVEDILDYSEIPMFLFNPMQGYPNLDVSNDLFTLLIEHYEEDEEYEKCDLLLKEWRRDKKLQKWSLENINET